jgi:glutathione S-transferase
MNIGATDVSTSDSGSGEGKEVKADIARIVSLWRDTRGRFGADGPFLFGAWTAADAFFAPVVCRFETYGVLLDDDARAYCEAVLAWRPLADWIAAAQAASIAPRKRH